MRAKAQHTVSQFYLRPFRSRVGHTPGDDEIWCYFKPTGLCREQKISKVAVETRFYDWTAPSGRIISFEDQLLGRLESLFAPALDAVLTDPCHDTLMAYRSKIASFVACQAQRTGSFRKAQQEAYGLLGGLEPESDNDRAASQMRFMLTYLQPAAALYLRKRWILAHNETDVLLWTSDNPVALHRRARWTAAHRPGLDGRRNEHPIEPPSGPPAVRSVRAGARWGGDRGASRGRALPQRSSSVVLRPLHLLCRRHV